MPYWIAEHALFEQLPRVRRAMLLSRPAAIAPALLGEGEVRVAGLVGLHHRSCRRTMRRRCRIPACDQSI